MVIQNEYFKFNGDVSKTVFICLGNRDRADDAVGIEIGKELKKLPELNVYTEENDNIDTVLLDILENDSINKVVFIDAADFDSIPGTFIVTPLISDKIRVLSTHSFPLNHWEELLRQHGKQTVFIGIQVKTTNFMGEMSKEVKNAMEKTLELIHPVS